MCAAARCYPMVVWAIVRGGCPPQKQRIWPRVLVLITQPNRVKLPVSNVVKIHNACGLAVIG